MIKLRYVNGEIFVYDIQDWSVLRKNHRIVGHIIGSTSFIPSLPAKLLPEEVNLLLDKNLANIKEICPSLQKNTSQELLEERLLEAQQLKYKEIRKIQLESIIDKIVEKRRQSGDWRSKHDILEEELNKSSVVTKTNMIWPILLKSNNQSDCIPVLREKILKLTTPLKTSTFKDLWEKGYFVTNGEKFGGDFLVYLGDPLVHHAIFIVKCVLLEKVFSPTDLIAFGRLGVAVRKKAVLASLTDGKVSYMTINWIDA